MSKNPDPKPGDFTKLVAEASIVVAFATFLGPIITPLFAALGGWVIGITPVGAWVVEGFGLLGIHFIQADLWKVCAALSLVGVFMRTRIEQPKWKAPD